MSQSYEKKSILPNRVQIVCSFLTKKRVFVRFIPYLCSKIETKLIMDQNTDLSILFRVRTSSAVIRKGYQLYVANFRRLFGSSWVAALAYAIVVALTMSFYISQMPPLVVATLAGGTSPELQGQMALTGLLVSLAGLVLLVVASVLMSYDVSAFGEHQASGTISGAERWYGRLDRKALWPTLRLTGWWVLVAMLASLIMAAAVLLATRHLGHIAGMALIGTTALVMAAAVLPMTYTSMKYLLTPKASFPRLLLTTYSIGLRHWGAIFIVTLVTVITAYVCTLLTELPALILYLANLQSLMGVMQGDPAGMPGYMAWMNIFVFAIAGFIQAYINLSALFPLYYLYGSIEAEENERNQHKNTIEQ